MYLLSAPRNNQQPEGYKMQNTQDQLNISLITNETPEINISTLIHADNQKQAEKRWKCFIYLFFLFFIILFFQQTIYFNICFSSICYLSMNIAEIAQKRS